MNNPRPLRLGNCLVSIRHEYKQHFDRVAESFVRVPRSTEVTVIDSKGKEVTGKSICSKKDLFQKETGRKIALKRALEQLSLTKEERKRVWDDYRNRNLKTK
jgi:hypothetical protein